MSGGVPAQVRLSKCPNGASMSSWLYRTADHEPEDRVRSLIEEGFLSPESPAVLVHEMDAMGQRLEELHKAFPPDTLHAIAIKANPLLEVLRALVGAGAGLEAASRGELELALRAGCPVDRIVLDSPAKTQAELSEALRVGVRINANSESELARLERLGGESHRAPIGLRFNPVVAEASRESPTMVATLRSKFGLPEAAFRAAVEGRSWVTGIHVHVGSQVATRQDLVLAARRTVELARGLPQIGWIDIGGGLPTRYHRDDPGLSPESYVAGLRDEVPELFGYPLVTEVGRALQANCGWAVSRVEYADEGKAIVHLGADFALRECYQPQSWHHDIGVYDGEGRKKTGPTRPIDLYGPLCFSGDRLAIGRQLPHLEEGDHVVIHDTGGYTLGMWSRYCSREIPQVVGWTGRGWKVLRARETPADLVGFWSAPQP